MTGFRIYSSFQKLSGSHKALVEMQDDVSELLRSAIREYKQTKVSVWPVSTLSHHRMSPQQPPPEPRAVLPHCGVSDDIPSR